MEWQIGYRTVLYIQYAGPLVITPLLLFSRELLYGEKSPVTLNQVLGVLMVLGHFIKRVLETALVHRFSNETMPVFDIIKNCFYYWILFGALTMSLYLHPDYTPPSWAKPWCFWIAFLLFGFFEFMNLKTHMVLRDLRSPGSSERGIPKGWGFDQVSCANYLWETLAWIVFCVQAQVFSAYVFLAAAIYQMALWAIKKHKRLQKEFPDYPRNRNIMIPYVF